MQTTQIGAARPRDEARARFDAVRVLQRRGRDVDARLVARQFLRQRAPFRLAGEDIERGQRRLRREHGGQRDEQFNAIMFVSMTYVAS